MDRDRMRVLVLALVSIAAIVVGTLIADWFLVRITGVPALAEHGIDKFVIDLREASACDKRGVCSSYPIAKLRSGSLYPTLATISFWGGLLYALLIAYQCGSRLLSGFANETIGKSAYAIGALLFCIAVGAGYLFGLETGTAEALGAAIVVERGWGAVSLLFGYASGIVALYYAGRQSSGLDDADYAPLDPKVPPALARMVAARHAAEPARPKLSFATTTAELTRAGIEARREDGHTVLVLWRDVVNVIARRLPSDVAEGVTFVDVVSTAGQTLRLLPWTKLLGETTVDGQGSARARAIVALIASRCPAVQLDAATRSFVDSAMQPATQLPDAASLAEHDARLA
jgi:hypothetical protein